MVTVVANSLGESDERERLDTCFSRVQESHTELTKCCEKAKRYFDQLSLDPEVVTDRSVAQTSHQISRNFKTVQTLLREQMKYELPQYFAESLLVDLQKPEDVLRRLKDDEATLRKFKTLEAFESALTAEGHAVVNLRWTLGFSASIVFTGLRPPQVTLTSARVSPNLSAFLRILHSETERRLVMAQNLPKELCNWVDKSLLSMFTSPCKGCGRVLSFGTGVPMLAMVVDIKGEFFHEECIREPIDEREE